MAQNKPTLRKLTKNESELRRKEDERRNRQWYIDTIVQFKVYQARLIAILTKLNKNGTFPDTDPQPIISPWTPIEQTNIDIAEIDTLLHPITPYHGYQKPFITTTYPVVVRATPITGDNIKVSEITQDKQPNKPTTTRHTYQDTQNEIKRIQQKLVEQGQEVIRNYYQERFIALHPDEEFFEDYDCMPRSIKMTAMNNLTLSPLLDGGKYFPGTRVLVVVDMTLGDQFICE